MAATQPQAMAKALGTTEILEHVLTMLPLQDIVKGQLVCKKWRALVEKSPTLRQHRFLDPDTSAKASGGRETNPLLLSTVLSHAAPGFECELDHLGVRDVLSWRKGRWEQAFITQPPLERMSFSVYQRAGWCATGMGYVVADPNGIRLGLLVDELRSKFELRGVNNNTFVTLEESHWFR